MTDRIVVLAFVVSGLGVLVAGCGGSGSPSVANLGNTTSPVTTSQRPEAPSAAALASCLTSHGLSASVGSSALAPNGSIHIAGVIVTGAQPGSSQFQAAIRACSADLPGGGPPSATPAQRAEWAKAMAAFAACMRRSGVPSFPDPTGQGTFPPGSLGQLDPQSPLVRKAFKACEPLEPKSGPHLQI